MAGTATSALKTTTIQRPIHFLRCGIAAGLGVLQLLHVIALGGVEPEKFRRHGRQATARQPPVESVRIVANGLDVVHGMIPRLALL
jgi:hypothetical protein